MTNAMLSREMEELLLKACELDEEEEILLAAAVNVE